LGNLEKSEHFYLADENNSKVFSLLPLQIPPLRLFLPFEVSDHIVYRHFIALIRVAEL